MSHIFRLPCERTLVQLGETKGTETVSISIMSTLSLLMLGAIKASPNYHLRSNIRGLQSVLRLVLRRLMVLGTLPRALRMLRSRRDVLSPCALRRTT